MARSKEEQEAMVKEAMANLEASKAELAANRHPIAGEEIELTAMEMVELVREKDKDKTTLKILREDSPINKDNIITESSIPSNIMTIEANSNKKEINKTIKNSDREEK